VSGSLDALLAEISVSPLREPALIALAERAVAHMGPGLSELLVKSTPVHGALTKGTALAGQIHVDVGVVVAPRSPQQRELPVLLERVQAAAAGLPDCDVVAGDARVDLVHDGVTVCVRPMLAMADRHMQTLLGVAEYPVRTSVQRHSEFIQARIESSDLAGGEPFDGCLRLVKHWRDLAGLGDTLPTMVLELLFSDAYDRVGTAGSLDDSLARWFDTAAETVSERRPVAFSDFATPREDPDPFSHWCVLDPVNIFHNLVMAWTPEQVGALAAALWRWRAVLY